MLQVRCGHMIGPECTEAAVVLTSFQYSGDAEPKIYPLCRKHMDWTIEVSR